MKFLQTQYIGCGLLCLILTGFSATSLSQENPQARGQESKEEAPESIQDSSTSSPEPQQASEEETDEGTPSAEDLRRKELSQAFEEFSPSEEITADNAVPFPRDI